MAVIAGDLGGTKFSIAIFDDMGKILFEKYSLLEKRSGKEIGRLICNDIFDCLNYSGNNHFNIDSIGICVPGIYWNETKTVWAPNIRGWENYPLFDEIISTLALKNIPLSIDSDRACSILGENWLGAAKGCNNAIFLAIGTGIGAGILVEGNILRGSNDIAGAIGWMGLNRPFSDEYIDCGCFEYYASGEGLKKNVKKMLSYFSDQKDTDSYLRKFELNKISTKNIFDAYEFKDEIAMKVVDQAIEFWGMAVANLVSLFNPEKIIFGGGVFGPAAKFIPKIYEEAKKWSQPISIKKIKLEPSLLGNNAVLIGAGYLAIKNKMRIK